MTVTLKVKWLLKMTCCIIRQASKLY